MIRGGPPPLCLGLGIVKAVDVKRCCVFYISTPVSHEVLQKVKILLQGRVEIPVPLLMACFFNNVIHCRDFHISIRWNGCTRQMEAESITCFKESAGLFGSLLGLHTISWSLDQFSPNGFVSHPTELDTGHTVEFMYLEAELDNSNNINEICFATRVVGVPLFCSFSLLTCVLYRLSCSMRGAVSIALAFNQFTIGGDAKSSNEATLTTITITVLLFSTIYRSSGSDASALSPKVSPDSDFHIPLLMDAEQDENNETSNTSAISQILNGLPRPQSLGMLLTAPRSKIHHV